MKKPLWLLSLWAGLLLFGCSENKTDSMNFDDYPVADTVSLWPEYRPEASTFRLWSPPAEAVQLHLYESGDGGAPTVTHQLDEGGNGLWSITLPGDHLGVYYTFQVKTKGKWLEETPGIYAQAVGVNGRRAMVVDLARTNPEGWEADKGPAPKLPSEAIIYELQIRDMTIHPESGSGYPGKYLGLAEGGTKGPGGVSTGIDHISELGVTHVHLLPAFDHYSIDETRLDEPQYNWGYDPQNYNVPEGSFSTDPYRGEVRIREFKEMVKAFHDRGIGVILDVVYNHTGGRMESSNFNLEVPGYYYRHWPDGAYANSSACGNETASERPMMRRFMLESVAYWTREYHLDGFRFDLMGIHDIETMNEIADTLKAINPNILIYGEGWTAGDSPLPEPQRALKKHTAQMPQISAFSDDLRDGLKGSVFEDMQTGFVSGAEGREASILFGLVGAIQHPQIDYAAVNYSDAPWTQSPWQAVSYVSCHDNHTLYDKLRISRPDATEAELIAMDKLANAIVLTSQGMAFLHAGEELLRTKQGEHNSFESPDSINQIDWTRKTAYPEVVKYYQNLIALRKAHPGFRLPTAADVQRCLHFQTVEKGLISYRLSELPAEEPWKEIFVVYNARPEAAAAALEGEWQVAVRGDEFTLEKGKKVSGAIEAPGRAMTVLYKER